MYYENVICSVCQSCGCCQNSSCERCSCHDVEPDNEDEEDQ